MPTQEQIDQDYIFDEDEDCDEDDWADLQCGLADDGQCSQAGTEWCDFECPYRDSEDFAGSVAWHAKRGHRT